MVILPLTAHAQQAPPAAVTLQFNVSAFDLKGNLLPNNPEKVAATVKVYLSQGSDNTRNLRSLNAASFYDANRPPRGLIYAGTFNIGNDGAPQTVKLPAQANPDSENVITLVFNRPNSTLITAVVSYVPVLTEEVNGKRQFVAKQEHTLKVVVPEAVDPCVRVGCSTVKKRKCFLGLK